MPAISRQVELWQIFSSSSLFLPPAAASKKKEKRFFGDTPNPGKGPRPLQSRLFKWYWPPAAAGRRERSEDTSRSGRENPAPLWGVNWKTLLFRAGRLQVVSLTTLKRFI